MKSGWEGILASIFDEFWWIFGSKLGGKMEPRSIQEGIEKAMEKWIASRWPKSRNKPLRGVAIRGVQGPGEETIRVTLDFWIVLITYLSWPY